MSRFSLCAILLASASSVITFAVIRTWAADPPQAAKKVDDDPFGDRSDPAPTQSKSSGTTPAPASGNPFDEAPAGLRPWPAGPTNFPRVTNQSGSAERPLHGVGVAATAKLTYETDRGLTQEMALAPQPPAAIDALSESAAAIAEICTALKSITDIDCKETPLQRLVEQLKKQHKIEIQLDAAGLQDAGVDPTTPVTKHCRGISLRSALHLMLDELQLKYVIHDQVLLITSPQKAESEEFMLTRVYPVKDLVLVRNEKDEIQTDFQPLIDVIENTVAEKSWIGGVGTIAPCLFHDQCLLVVTQTQDVQDEIADLIDSLRRFERGEAKAGREPQLPKLRIVEPRILHPLPASQSQAPAPASNGIATGTPSLSLSSNSVPPRPDSPSIAGLPMRAGCARILTPEMATAPEPLTIGDPDITPAEAKIFTALASPTQIDCEKTPLKELVEQLKKRHKIEIQLDTAGLKDAGVDETTPITRHLSGVTLRAALRLMFDELQLKYVIHNEVLLITSPQKAERDEFMTTKLYAVKDLVLVRNENGEIETDFESLKDLLDNSIATKTWEDNGGTGMITSYQYHDHCMLVVSQTQEVHEEIANLLAALRRCRPADPKGGNDLRLPQRLKTTAPKFNPMPGSPQGTQGGGWF